jgi:hypothetical protein
MYSTQVSGSLPRFSAALRSAFCTVALMAVSPTVGLADVATQTAQRCIVQTKAPGNYFISEAPGVPAAGAANVNDCLNDAYGVQFGSPTGQVTATRASAPIGGQAATSGSVDCSRILNRSPGRAAAYSLGSSIVAGAIGASVQAGVYQRNLNNCLAQRAAPRVDPNAAVFTGCSRQHGVLSGGTSLCVSQ